MIFLVSLVLTAASELHSHDQVTYERLCGRDALYVLLSLSGYSADFDLVTDACMEKQTKAGLSVESIVEIASGFGLSLAAVRLSPADLQKVDFAFIAYVKDDADPLEHGHFFVVNPQSDGYQVLNPPKEPRIVSKSELTATWDGVALLPRDRQTHDHVRAGIGMAVLALTVVIGRWAWLNRNNAIREKETS